jgi:hypothetical protein
MSRLTDGPGLRSSETAAESVDVDVCAAVNVDDGAEHLATLAVASVDGHVAG